MDGDTSLSEIKSVTINFINMDFKLQNPISSIESPVRFT
jgi:hypothetical protein